MKLYKASLAAAIAAAIAPTTSFAQDDVIALEEIVVTAQKREQNLQDVPLSVQVVDGKLLEDRNINQVAELAKVSPGFTFAEGGSDSSKGIIIRGIGSQSFSRGMDQSVGVVVDGVIADSAAASVLDMSDVERIEVLRGPQGMLFGKNASAGLLNITTKRPTDELSYGMSASYAELNQQKVSAYVSGPLIEDKVLGRLNYYSTTQDGLIENEYPGGKDHGDRDEWGINGKLEILATDNLSILLSASHTDRDQTSNTTAVVNFSGAGDLIGGPTIHPTGKENDKIFDNNTSVSQMELTKFSAELNYDWGDYTLTSITSWSKSDAFSDSPTEMLGGFNTDNALGQLLAAQPGLTPTASPVNSSQTDIKQITQEFRITSPEDRDLTYVAGMYFYKRDMDLASERMLDGYLASAGFAASLFPTNAAMAALAAQGSPFWGALISDVTDSEVNNESFALFGQATYHINDVQRLSVGLRYNHEKVEVEQDAQVHDASVLATLPATYGGIVAQHNAGNPFVPLGFSEDDDTDEAISWRVIYEYDAFDDGMVYASWARGYKGPGVNTLPGALKFADTIVEPEIPTNYELGFKSQLWDNRLRLNANVFFTEFKDFQSQVSDGNIPPTFVLQNAGELETYGLEMDFALAATENLVVSGGLAYIKAEFAEYEGAACYPGQTLAQGCAADGTQDLSGTPMPNSPEWSVSLNGRYNIPLADLPFDAYLQGSYYWQDEVQFTADNDPLSKGDAYGIADFAVGIEAEDGTYDVQLFVKNAFDEFYVSGYTSTFRNAGIEVAHFLPYDYERRVGVSMNLNF
ncbi:TonB-dependent receptor [Maricurvus nonylphenolicus]|uniref:TonB-dependent receptor n=1 Tax=Maricurvus nonylphenolicus TaxID=1008307 RepID=UPI0036F2FF0A